MIKCINVYKYRHIITLGLQVSAMLPLQPFLDSLLSSLPPLPISKAQHDSLVKKTLDDSRGKSSLDNRKGQWEYLLKNEVFKLAVRCCSSSKAFRLTSFKMTEGTALKEDSASYYEQVKVRLDLVLTFTEQGELFSPHFTRNLH
jgi:hypothetical protein